MNRNPATGIRKAHEPIMIGNAAMGFMPSRLTRMRQGAYKPDAESHQRAEHEVAAHGDDEQAAAQAQ